MLQIFLVSLAKKPICSTIGPRRSWFSATSRRSTSSFLPIRAKHILAPLWTSFSLPFHSSKTAVASGLYAITTTKKACCRLLGQMPLVLFDSTHGPYIKWAHGLLVFPSCCCGPPPPSPCLGRLRRTSCTTMHTVQCCAPLGATSQRLHRGLMMGG